MRNTNIVLTHAALQQLPGEKGGRILRGALLPEVLSLLKIDDYQREILPGARAASLKEAFIIGDSVPDIVLGLRGHKYNQRDGRFSITGNVYTIDGWQRVNAALAAIADPDGRKDVSLGASLYFDTTVEWERALFYRLNAERTRLSASILVRNMRHENQAIALIHQMATNTNGNQDFAMHNRICWEQRMKSKEMMTAATLVKVITRLHAHIVPGIATKINIIAQSLSKLADEIGDDKFVKNITTFFDIIDGAWGIKRLSLAPGSASWMKAGFVMTLARLFSTHTDFWNGRELVVKVKARRKLGMFSVADPRIEQLAGASGSALDMLYALMRDDMNKGLQKKNWLKVNPKYINQNTEPDPIADVLELEADPETNGQGPDLTDE